LPKLLQGKENEAEEKSKAPEESSEAGGDEIASEKSLDGEFVG
jgi:hypothetical protein